MKWGPLVKLITVKRKTTIIYKTYHIKNKILPHKYTVNRIQNLAPEVYTAFSMATMTVYSEAKITFMQAKSTAKQKWQDQTLNIFIQAGPLNIEGCPEIIQLGEEKFTVFFEGT